jgi:hypothetical protein
MSKVAKNIKNNVVSGWVVVSVECKVRTEQPTIQKTKPLAENLNANLPAFAKKSKLFVAKYLKALNCPTFTYYNVRTYFTNVWQGIDLI